MSDEAARAGEMITDGRFDRPILIVSTPRSGSTLLFETMEQAPGLYSIGDESHGAIESVPAFHPATRKWQSNRLTAEDAKPQPVERLANNFYDHLRDRDGRAPTGPVRMLEKTPKNALRVPFFNAIWPDATFIYLYRDVRQTLASMIEAWASGNFRTYPQLPGWAGYPWSLLLVPGWQKLRGQPLPVIVAHQWSITTTMLLDDLVLLPRERVRALRHADLVAEPNTRIPALARSVGLAWDRDLSGGLPLSKYTVTQPNPDKWRRFEQHIEAVMPVVAEADERAKLFVAQFER